MINIFIFIICVIILSNIIIWLVESARRRARGVQNFFTHGYRRFVWLGVLLILGLIFISLPPSSDSREGSGEENTVIRLCPPPQKQKIPKYFPFEGGKGFTVYLKAGWKCYPRGGNVKMKTPDNMTFIFKPGVYKYVGYQPDGVYIFYPEESKTLGVEIYNYW